MVKRITRRHLLSNGIKTGLGLVVLKNIGIAPRSVLAVSQESKSSERFSAAFQRLDEFIARHMNELGAPGMTVAIADRNGLVRESQYGFSDLKSQVKVKSETLFEIGSISKSFVGLTILQLAEEGKLDLHKPVSAYLPWLKVESKFKPFTTHHLLSHTAGLSAVPLLMRVAATTLRTASEPGTRFVYSNIGYVLLGFIIEEVDKRPFAESLQKRVIDKLGMSSSAATITNSIRERMAVGYGPLHDDRPFPFKGTLAEAPWLEVAEAAGSVAATGRDMGAYLQMLLNRGAGPRGRIISEKSFELFTQPVIKAPFRGEEATYGYGLWNSSVDGHTLLRHTGGMVAFSSSMFADTTAGLGVFASVNARMSGYRPVAVTKYALDLLNAATNGRALPAAPPPPNPPDRIQNASDYAGTFTAPDGSKLVLVAEDQRLFLEVEKRRIALELAGRDRFIVKDPHFSLFVLGFGRDKEAVVEAFHGPNWWANARYSGPKSFEYPKEWEAFTGHYRCESPWYGSTRVFVRKGQLFLQGEQALVHVTGNEFRPEGDNPDRIVFDTRVNGKTMHMNYSGLDFYRTFTP
ncbi:MAG TPA: serine hydrolase domain-containing protein [Pyrinomonadaceae bacterium]